jgi:hypothetical protein
MQTQELLIATTTSTIQPGDVSPGWHTLISPWWNATLAILPTFLITRFIFLLLSYFGGVLFFVPNYWSGHLSFNDVFNLWYRWDVIRYATIAMNGYQSLDYAAFFPLYPVLEQILYHFLHRGILAIGMLISNLAYLGTLIVLYRFVEVEFDRETAQRTTLYLSIFPSAVFFFAAYNESLFLFFMLLSFYTMRRGSWWLAGLFGGLATLTRSIGLLLFVIFICEFARQRFPMLWSIWHERMQPGRQITRSLVALVNILPSLFIPLALGIYAYALNVRFHDPLAFDHAQVHWRTSLNFPWVAPWLALKSIFSMSPFTFAVPHDIIELTALSLFSLLLVLCFVGPERLARDQWTFALFGLLALGFALLFPGVPSSGGVPYDPMPSTERFVLEIFVGFIILARLGRRPWFHQSYLLISLPLLAFFTFQFMTGHWTV